MTPRVLLVVLACVLSLAGACGRAAYAPHDPPPVSTDTSGAALLVDPFVGTGDSNSPAAVTNGGGGSTFPGAALPFGMVQWSPDTPHASPPGYSYSDDSITAFSLTHLSGAGCAAERDFPVFPFVARPDFGAPPEEHFSHADEKASPGFYEVKLPSGILVDLTATKRTGLARFTFPDHADAHITISSGGKSDLLQVSGFDANISGDDLVTGSRTNGGFCVIDPAKYRVYFAARFDRPFADFGTFADGDATAGSREVSGGTGNGVYLRFQTDATRVVGMKVGLSYVSVENAVANLDAENPGWDFDAVHAGAIANWNDYLERIQIEGGTADERRSFYTALYHALLQPAIYSDADGSFLGFDGQLRKDADHPRYTNYSGWDVYRSWIHLLALLAPKEASDVARSLVGSGGECGALPQWSLANHAANTMVGDPADATLAGAWAFGARDFDAQAALALMRRGATDPNARCNDQPSRPGLADYLARGFCPIDARDGPRGPTSTTLEYAVADFAIAQFAKALGDDATYKDFLARGQNWRAVFDGSFMAGGQQGYIQPRFRNDIGGQPSFQPTDPASTDGFVEGNPAQYTFFVPHDPYGLVTALGGDATTVARLDALFTELNAGTSRPYFYMGNEPQFGTPWLYPFAGAPHRTQAVVRRILREAFAATPGGLPGNDDLGATSAWQVWAMLGMYPAIPGTGVLVLGSPSFPKATVTLGSGAKLVILGEGASSDAPYVQSVRLNGQPLTRSFVSWDEISAGATLDVSLGTAADTTWGSAAADRPTAFYP